jgi:hypothetical protein
VTNTPTTWRDLAEQLTPVQIETLERCEADPTDPKHPEGHRRGMIAHAQMLAMRNRLAATVPPPRVSHFASADLSEWIAMSPDQWERHFVFSRRGTDIAVEIAGKQLMDGTLRGLHISLAVGNHCNGLDSAGARQVVADLQAAADELDRLSVPDGPVTSSRRRGLPRSSAD